MLVADSRMQLVKRSGANCSNSFGYTIYTYSSRRKQLGTGLILSADVSYSTTNFKLIYSGGIKT